MSQDIDDRVISAVDKQTSPKQPDTVSPRTVVYTLAGAGSMRPEDVHQGIQSRSKTGVLRNQIAGYAFLTTSRLQK